MLYGTQPEPWYLAVGPADTQYCTFSDAAFSEPDALVLLYESWSGVGIELRKAADFVEQHPTTQRVDGHLRYGPPGGFPQFFCVNANGEMTSHG